jgi:hypothetical protein
MTRPPRALAMTMWLAAGLSFGASLGGCVHGDSQAKYLPDYMKDKPPPPEAADAAPDVKALVRDRRQELFTGTVDSVLVGPPHPKGQHWMFCMKASARNASNQPMRPQLYLVEIDANVVGDRLPVDGAHWCAREPLEPV